MCAACQDGAGGDDGVAMAAVASTLLAIRATANVTRASKFVDGWLFVVNLSPRQFADDDVNLVQMSFARMLAGILAKILTKILEREKPIALVRHSAMI